MADKETRNITDVTVSNFSRKNFAYGMIEGAEGINKGNKSTRNEVLDLFDDVTDLF